MRLLPARLLRFRGLGSRFALTATDQCVASLSNFAVGVAVTRIAGIAALGAYSLAYVVWLAIADVHRSLITDPMAIENTLRGSDVKAEIRIGMAAEVALGVAFGGAVAVVGVILLSSGQHAYGIAFVALAPWLPFLLIQDYWRWVGFMKAMPAQALVNDVVFDLVQGLAFGLLFVVGVRSSVIAIFAWGLGALAATVLGLWQHRVSPAFGGGVARMRKWWRVSRGLLGGSITNWGASQSYLVLTGIMLGPAGIGGLRAALSLVNGPSYVLIQAGGSVGLPAASHALRDRGWSGLRRVERVVTAAALASVGIVGLVVLLWGRQLLVVFYGHEFARFALTADLLALSVLLGTAGVGAILSLKATKLTGMLFGKSAVSLVASIVSVVVLVPMFGVVGAAGSAVARSAVSAFTTLTIHLKFSRKAADAMTDATNRSVEDHPVVEEAGGPRRVGKATEAGNSTSPLAGLRRVALAAEAQGTSGGMIDAPGGVPSTEHHEL